MGELGRTGGEGGFYGRLRRQASSSVGTGLLGVCGRYCGDWRDNHGPQGVAEVQGQLGNSGELTGSRAGMGEDLSTTPWNQGLLLAP